jgi:hypothetical protein
LSRPMRDDAPAERITPANEGESGIFNRDITPLTLVYDLPLR